MSTVCNSCGFIRKDYNNIYGTWCIKCGEFIAPINLPKFLEQRNKEKKEMQEKVLKIWRDKK